MTASAAMLTSNPESKIQQIQAAYQRRVDNLRETNDATFREAQQLAEALEERNVLAVRRLIQLFGVEVVAAKAAEAAKLFAEAQARGAEAYAKSKEGQPVATRKGQPRTLGGVFFFLMRQHSDTIGVRWAGVDLPKLPGAVAHMRPKVNKPPSEQSVTPTANQPATTVEKPPAQPKPPAASQLKASSAAPTDDQTSTPASLTKPARAKITVIGSMVGTFKLNPQKLEGVVEFLVNVEMSTQALPKGLPSLGATPVVVWCTQKQFNKVKDKLKPDSRLIIEGEPKAVARIGADGKPIAFLRVICLNLTTPELQAAARQTNKV